MRILSLLFLIILISCKTETKSTSYQDKLKAQAENITIIRDHYGVPHIYGKTDADAVFGLLYAQCEDDFNRVEQNYIWLQAVSPKLRGKSFI